MKISYVIQKSGLFLQTDHGRTNTRGDYNAHSEIDKSFSIGVRWWRQVPNAPIWKIKLAEIRMLEFCQSWTLYSKHTENDRGTK